MKFKIQISFHFLLSVNINKNAGLNVRNAIISHMCMLLGLLSPTSSIVENFQVQATCCNSSIHFSCMLYKNGWPSVFWTLFLFAKHSMKYNASAIKCIINQCHYHNNSYTSDTNFWVSSSKSSMAAKIPTLIMEYISKITSQQGNWSLKSHSRKDWSVG